MLCRLHRSLTQQPWCLWACLIDRPAVPAAQTISRLQGELAEQQTVAQVRASCAA